jgi:hypothetical protein
LWGFANQGSGHPAGAVNEIVPKTTLDTQVAVINHGIKWRADVVDIIVLDVQVQVAAYTAKWTGGGDDSIGFKHNFLRIPVK